MEQKSSYQYINAQPIRDEVKRLRTFYGAVIENIKSIRDLKKYLTLKNDVYTLFMLDLLEKQDQGKTYEEYHHIIPKSLGGPDEDWNLLPISYLDHTRAHELRLEAYEEIVDHLGLRLRKNLTLQERRDAKRRGLETQKLEKKGFYDPAMQSLRGKKGGAKQTQAKFDGYTRKVSPAVKQALEKGMIWYHTSKAGDIDQELFFSPGTHARPQELYWALFEVEASSFSSSTIIGNHTGGLTKVILGKRKSYQGWSVSFLTIEEAIDYLENDLLD